jgi:hypothetical protein
MPKPIYFLGVLGVALIACSALAKPNQEIVSSPQATKPPVEEVASNEVDNPYSESPCPSDMVLIDGDWCPKVSERCLYNVDNDGNRLPGSGNDMWACGEFEYPSVCLSKTRVHMRYCIDRFEYPNKEGQIPQDWMAFYDAEKAAKVLGKRMCLRNEWTLAAEGPNLHPLPYGDGYHRDKTACNFDNPMPRNVDVFKATTPNSPMSQILRSLLVPSGSNSRCVSDYGVHDMAGNIDEFTINETGSPYVSALKGGHIWHIRAGSRFETLAHGPTFAWYETGTRLCLDPKF